MFGIYACVCMIIEEQTLYVGAAGLVFVTAAAMAIVAARFEKPARRHVAVVPTVLAVLGVGYLGMAAQLFVGTSPTGEPVYFTRFGAYLITYTVLMGYIGLVAGATRRYRLLPVAVVIGFTIGAAGAQLTEPPLESAGQLLVVASLAVGFWAFFGPLSRAAASVSGSRRLLFSKLRNLAALALIMYLLVSVTNRAALGLLDAFVGIFTITYVDLVGHIGLAGLLVYSREAIASLSEQYSSPLSLFRDP